MLASLPLREIGRMHEPPRVCSYLPDQTAALEYRLFADVSPDQFGELLRRGWRRHGIYFFRPACPQCRQCRSLRVIVEEFRASKSQRRCLSRNQEIEVTLTRPQATTEHVELYNDYHADMATRRGWKDKATTLSEYAEGFPAGDYEFAYEMQYRRGSQLVGVGLVDITPLGMSSIYFFHAPDWRPAGPGVFSALRELDLASRLRLRHVYLGYWISACPSMAYKDGYRPHELLRDHVADDAEPVWDRPADSPSETGP